MAKRRETIKKSKKINLMNLRSPYKSRVYSKYLHHWFLIIVIGIAFYIRRGYVFIERLWPDEALYCWYAQKIHHFPSLIFSKEIIEFHPPLFSILLSLAYFFPSPETACRIAPLIINILGIAVIYFIGTKISGRFLGIFCSIALTFNYLYLAQAFLVLIDNLLVVFFMLLVLLLLRVRPENPVKYEIYVGLTGSCIVLIKWSGVLVLPLLAAYYLFAFPELSLSERIKKVSVPLSIIIFVILLLLLNNIIQLGQVFPDVSALKGILAIRPFWYYIINLHRTIMVQFLLPFFCYGLYVVLRREGRKARLLSIWFIVFLAGISCAYEKDLRYSLLIVPSIFLIAGIGLEELFQKYLKTQQKIFIAKIVCILFILFINIGLYPDNRSELDKQTIYYSGFKEAGRWIKNEASSQTLVIAGSKRAIRYYSGINFREFGGRILGFPKTKEEFEKIISNKTGSFILEIDCWEFTQPEWAYPSSEEKVEYFKGLGFRVEKVFYLLVKNEKKYIIWLLKKP